jgi:hypothetical protein
MYFRVARKMKKKKIDVIVRLFLEFRYYCLKLIAIEKIVIKK